MMRNPPRFPCEVQVAVKEPSAVSPAASDMRTTAVFLLLLTAAPALLAFSPTQPPILRGSSRADAACMLARPSVALSASAGGGEKKAKLPPGWDQFEGLSHEYFADKYKDNQIDGFAGPVYTDVKLHLAVVAKNEEEVTELLEQGADIDEQNERGWTALMYSAKVADPGLADALLGRGADASLQDGFGNTALHHACTHDPSSAIASALLSAAGPGAGHAARNKAGLTPLHSAAAAGNKAAAAAMLDAGADPNARTAQGFTPLLEACQAGADECVALLLARGADASLADEASGDTPLHVAAYEGSHATIEMLLEGGANCEARNGEESSPLFMAAKAGSAKSVSLLLSRGADASGTCARGRSALHEASRWGKLSAVEALLKGGADPNAKDEGGSTPLHEAALWGRARDDEEVAEVLVAGGADVAAENAAGETPVAVARDGMDEEDAEESYLVQALS